MPLDVQVQERSDSAAGAGNESNNPIGALLRNRHPELFNVAPRPGGFVRSVLRDSSPAIADVRASKVSYDDRPAPSNREDVDDVTRRISLQSARAANVTYGNVPCSDVREPSKEEERDNVVRMCSVAIGTVMLLAQRTYGNVTLEHLEHTEEYFRGLKQEDGYPRNVGQLMRVLANLKRAGRIVTQPSDEDDATP